MKRIVTPECHAKNSRQLNSYQNLAEIQSLVCLSNSINISKGDDVLRIIQEGLFFKLRISTLKPCLH